MEKKKKKSKKKWIITLVGIAVVLFIGSRILVPKPMSYESVEGKSEDITTWYSFSGNIEANNREVLFADSPFTVAEILVEAGDLVEAGTELLEIESGENPASEMSGEITEVFVEENESVSPGTKLISIVDYSDLEVVVKVDEFELDAVTEGKEVVVRVNALDKEYSGTVESLSKEGTVMNGVTYFMAVVKLEDDDALKVGMSTEVTLLKEEVKGAVTLPMTAIRFHDDNTPYVLKKGTEGIAVEVDITTGIHDGTRVEIIEGVQVGESILLEETGQTSGFGIGGGLRQELPGGEN